ncbi:hypothetical protein MPER_08803, partial [Moniliophthora perniciosa FA553]
MLPAPFLPLEIVENIVHHVVTSDPLATTLTRHRLRTCALVSTIWLKAARTYFFPSFQFDVPKNLQRLEALESLFRSPVCTMHLGKIERLHMNRCYATVYPFLEWCTSTEVKQLFQGARQIKIVDISRSREPLSISVLSVLAENFLNVSHIDIHYVRFSSFNQFTDFLTSFPQLQWLECTRMDVPRKHMTEHAVVLPQLRKLRVDSYSFFYTFPDNIALDCLEDLDFSDPFSLCLGQRDLLRRFQKMGNILSYAGRRLRRLRIALAMLPEGRLVDNIKSRLSKSLDLSNKAPLIRELELSIYDTLVLPALTFENPHPTLKSITISRATLNYSELDAILERSTPSLQHLKFAFNVAVARET